MAVGDSSLLTLSRKAIAAAWLVRNTRIIRDWYRGRGESKESLRDAFIVF